MLLAAVGADVGGGHLDPTADADDSAADDRRDRCARQSGPSKVGQLGTVEQSVDGSVQPVGQRLGGGEVDLGGAIAGLDTPDGAGADATENGDISDRQSQFGAPNGDLVDKHLCWFQSIDRQPFYYNTIIVYCK